MEPAFTSLLKNNVRPDCLLRRMVFAFLLFSFNDFFAQDDRYQLPVSLQKSYFEVNVGVIDYNFSDMLFI